MCWLNHFQSKIDWPLENNVDYARQKNKCSGNLKYRRPTHTKHPLEYPLQMCPQNLQGTVQRGAYLGVQFWTVKKRRKATARPMTFVTGRPHFGKRKGCFFSNGRIARRGHQLPGHFEKSGPQYPIKLKGQDLSFKITTTCFSLLDQYVFWTTSVSRKDD